MVISRKKAELISQFFMGIGGQIDDFLAGQEHELSSEEFKILRRACGYVLAEIYTEVLNPLFKAHPEITPDELK
jgi:hypothetical protein